MALEPSDHVWTSIFYSSRIMRLSFDVLSGSRRGCGGYSRTPTVQTASSSTGVVPSPAGPCSGASEWKQETLWVWHPGRCRFLKMELQTRLFFFFLPPLGYSRTHQRLHASRLFTRTQGGCSQHSSRRTSPRNRRRAGKPFAFFLMRFVLCLF